MKPGRCSPSFIPPPFKERLAPHRRLLSRRSFVLTLAAGALLLLSGWLALPLVPLPKALFQTPAPQFQFTDRNGLALRAVRAPEQPFGQSVAYTEIPPALVRATLAAEDQRFWRHPGVDWRSTARAAWELARHRRIVSGGSTISQQLIKLAEPRPRTFRTKLIEAVQALRLEQVWDKQRILTAYLNRLDYGNFNAGCAAAAEFYFSKPLRELSPAECALLAGLPQAPTRLNPLKHWDRAHNRQQWILQRMRQNGFLTSDEFARAKAEPLRLVSSRRPFEAPHFVDLLLQQMASPGSARSRRTPYAAQTTLDLHLNRYAEQLVRRQVALLGPQQVGNAAAVVLDNRTGGVLALVGSEDYFAPHAGQVNGAWAPRSAGSTLKPFTYLVALEQGATPASVVADVPSEFATATGLFRPVNYDHRCHGPMRYRLALANSLNIPAVKVLASIGGPAVLLERLQACGLTTLTATPEHYGLGLTIGNAEVRLLELANAYASLARLGEYRPVHLFEDGNPLTRTAGQGGGHAAERRVFDAAAAYLIADILSDNEARTLEFGVESNLRFDFPVACKTGTSSDFRDNWAFGYTPEFTVGVWAGNFDGTPMHGISGVTGAAPILHELMEYLHQHYGTSWYAQPGNVAAFLVHPVTGRLKATVAAAVPPGPASEASAEEVVRRLFPAGEPGRQRYVSEKFLAGHLPPTATDEDYDPQGRVRLPAEYRDWFASGDNWLTGKAVVDERAPALRILFPLPGTVFFLDPDLPDRGRRILLRAEAAGQPQWQSQTLPCKGEQGQTFAWLEKGQHRLQVRDSQTGLTRDTWIEVRER